MDAKQKQKFKADIELLRRVAWPRGGGGVIAVQNFLIKWEQFLLDLTKNKKIRGSDCKNG